MTSNFKIFLLVVSTLLLTSCFRMEEVKIKEIKSVKLLEFSEEGLVVESNIQIDNPNIYDIKLVNSEFNIMVNNRKIGKAHIGSDLKIPASSNDYHTLLLKSSTSDLSSSAIPSLIAITATGKDKLYLEVDGFIVGKVWLISKKVDVHHEGEVDLSLF